jgi:hypothetical protein
MLEKLIDGYCQLISYLIAALLALMVVLVFGNVFCATPSTRASAVRKNSRAGCSSG